MVVIFKAMAHMLREIAEAFGFKNVQITYNSTDWSDELPTLHVFYVDGNYGTEIYDERGGDE